MTKCSSCGVSHSVTSVLEPVVSGRLPPGLFRFLPGGWHIIGDVICVKIHTEIERYRYDVAGALLELYPRCSAVVRIIGIKGECREPHAELLLGDSAETVHSENGVRFSIDALRTMFSMGNHAERLRMAGVGEGEVVVDLFAGVGQLCLPMVVHGGAAKVYACELNPCTFEHLKRGIRLNGVQEIVTPYLGDCREVAPRRVADRVIMGYVRTTHEFLDVAIRALKTSGGIIHYHETAPQELVPERPLQRLRLAARECRREMRLLCWRRVKKYSPGVEHVVFDVKLGRVSNGKEK